MAEFPAGCPNFQLPRPLLGVVYVTEDGSVYVSHKGVTTLVWSPPSVLIED